MALTAGNVEVLRADITRTFDNQLAAVVPFWPRLTMTVPSDGYDERYSWLGSMPGMREWLGERIFNQLLASNYILANKDWESSVIVPKNVIADDRKGMYRFAIRNLANRAMYHPDELLLAAMVAGATELCFDGQFFYDTDHSYGASGSQSNKLTFDSASATAPTTTEFKAAFNQMVSAMLGYKNDAGQLLHAPTAGRLADLVLTVPPGLRQIAYDSLEAGLIVSGNAAVSNIIIDSVGIVALPGLTDASSMYLHQVGEPLMPFIFQARKPLDRQVTGDETMEVKELKMMTWARYNMGYGAWWNSVKMTFF